MYHIPYYSRTQNDTEKKNYHWLLLRGARKLTHSFKSFRV